MQPMKPEERREFQRLELRPPIPGTLGAIPVSILEIGVLGARVQHAANLDDKYIDLRFSYGGNEVGMKCEVVRTSAGQSKYPSAGMESGVRFLAAIGDSGNRLRDMLSELVTRELDARRTSPGSTPIPKRSIDGDKTVRGRDAGFICYRLENSRWHKRSVFLPEQPQVGFTVARWSESEDIKRLCQVYEASDEEGRRLIRLFAELSVSDVLEIPPRVAR
ncbi:MAG: hypothetical protein DMF57_08800 [Acidobacteria bacterium]|nr:MAG: hypothetical protein DMF57_08800 [Acidobacteriota bacterium]